LGKETNLTLPIIQIDWFKKKSATNAALFDPVFVTKGQY
jgi:hypothetical protein